MSELDRKCEVFLGLHARPGAFVIPNPWDVGSARILEGMGFEALATSSAGFAFTQGYQDGNVDRADALGHAQAIAGAVAVPVSADLENGFGAAPETVAETIRLAGETGVVGGSIEDASGNPDQPVLDLGLATERIAAAVDAAASLDFPFVLTARAENFLYGRNDLDDTIRRLQAFEAQGAQVLYAPGLPNLEAVREVCSTVSKPVNVLAAGALTKYSVEQLAEAGASRISLGSTLARHILGHLGKAAREILDSGTFEFTSVLGTPETVDRFMRTRGQS